MKKAIALSLVVALLASLAACGSAPIATQSPSPARTATPTAIPTMTATPVPSASPTPSPTFIPKVTMTPEPEETEEAEPTIEPNPVSEYDIPDLKKAGLTKEQYRKIELLLYGLLGMGKEFSNVKKLTIEDNLVFFNFIIEGGYEILGYGDRMVFKLNEIESVVNSGLKNNYHAKNGDKGWDFLQIQNGEIELQGNGGDPRNSAKPYSITKLTETRFQLKFHIVLVSNDGSYFNGLGQAVIEKDNESLFGFHLISFKEIKTNPVFAKAEASSWLPDTDTNSFMPEYCIDDEIMTGWATDKIEGAWLEISSTKAQKITGLQIYVGEKIKDYEDGYEVKEITARLELSDGTTIDWTISESPYQDEYCFITFNHEIATKYIKITFVSSESDPIYIAEIKPF